MLSIAIYYGVVLLLWQVVKDRLFCLLKIVMTSRGPWPITKMAVSDTDGFGIPAFPGADEEPQEVVIPAIYQRVVLRQSDYQQEADEFEEEDPEPSEYDLDLTSPPLES